MSPRRHTALFYAAFFSALGAHAPFWPVWLEDWGLTPAEVGLFVMTGTVTRVVAGLAMPVLADRFGMRRRLAFWLAIAGAAAFLGHLAIGSRTLLAVGTLAGYAMLSGIGPLSEALGINAARRHGFGYAMPRGLGSAGFLGASFACGLLIGRVGVDAALWWIVGSLLVAAALVRSHPGGGSIDGLPPPSLPEIARLLSSPTFLTFALASGFMSASMAVYFAYSSVHWRVLGLGEGQIGALWALAVAAEIAMLMTAGSRIAARLGPVNVMLCAALITAVRWAVMATDPVGPVLWLAQLAHAATFSLAHLGIMGFIGQAVPERYGASAQGAVQGLFGGLITAGGIGAAALMYPALGGQTYLLGTVFSLTGAGLCLMLGTRWRGQVLAV
jgi:PPP family 3-phenylpropionic acid transporter